MSVTKFTVGQNVTNAMGGVNQVLWKAEQQRNLDRLHRSGDMRLVLKTELDLGRWISHVNAFQDEGSELNKEQKKKGIEFKDISCLEDTDIEPPKEKTGKASWKQTVSLLNAMFKTLGFVVSVHNLRGKGYSS